MQSSIKKKCIFAKDSTVPEQNKRSFTKFALTRYDYAAL